MYMVDAMFELIKKNGSRFECKEAMAKNMIIKECGIAGVLKSLSKEGRGDLAD